MRQEIEVIIDWASPQLLEMDFNDVEELFKDNLTYNITKVKILSLVENTVRIRVNSDMHATYDLDGSWKTMNCIAQETLAGMGILACELKFISGREEAEIYGND